MKSAKTTAKAAKTTAKAKATNTKAPAKAVKLYACGTTWGWETNSSYPHALEFYTSPKAVLDDNDCAAECGVVEVTAMFKRTAIKAAEFAVPVLDLPRWQREDEAREKTCKGLADRILLVTANSDLDTKLGALHWALGGLERQKREERREARLAAEKKGKAKP